MSDRASFLERIFATKKNGLSSSVDADITPDTSQLKTVFENIHQLLDENFRTQHPDKYYLKNTLRFKLPGSERIDNAKIEMSFSTFNGLFINTVEAYVAKHELCDMSIAKAGTPAEPSRITFKTVDIEKVRQLHEKLQSSLQQQPSTETKHQDRVRFSLGKSTDDPFRGH